MNLMNLKFVASKLLNYHAPLKEKYIRGNQTAFMNKELLKAILTRTRLLYKLRKLIAQKTNWHTEGNVTTALNFSRDQKRISIIIST